MKCPFLSLLLRGKEKEKNEKKEKTRYRFLRSYERFIKWMLQAEPALSRSLSQLIAARSRRECRSIYKTLQKGNFLKLFDFIYM